MPKHSKTQIAAIPMQTIGPMKIIHGRTEEEVLVPLATYESPLWPSTHRGARVCTHAGGIRLVLLDDRMSRSVLVEADSAIDAAKVYAEIELHLPQFKKIVEQQSRYAQLLTVNKQLIGNLLYLRFEFTTGDASGHNMVTLASEHLLGWILQQYPFLKYVSLSGNVCSDKKVSAVNGILGRGKNVVADVVISRALCKRFLKTSPEKIVDLNIKKNLMGSIVAGGLRTANAHFANMLLAFYLATGQDAANIVEGSQGFVHAAIQGDDLYFSVTLPNLIVGTVGNGKSLDFVRDNLKLMGCDASAEPGDNAKRLAMIGAATVLCGELSLLAALTNPGELMRSHIQLERMRE